MFSGHWDKSFANADFELRWVKISWQLFLQELHRPFPTWPQPLSILSWVWPLFLSECSSMTIEVGDSKLQIFPIYFSNLHGIQWFLCAVWDWRLKSCWSNKMYNKWKEAFQFMCQYWRNARPPCSMSSLCSTSAHSQKRKVIGLHPGTLETRRFVLFCCVFVVVFKNNAQANLPQITKGLLIHC